MKKMIVIAFGMAVLGASAPANAAYTAAQQQACQGDAFKYCDHAIPDERKVRSCLLANTRKLSPACKAQFRRR
jgi:hypothetical protein